MNTAVKLPYTISRKGSNIALGFWILMIAACGVCLFALLYNDFYQPVPIIGLLALAALFLFFACVTRWNERIEFREGELFYVHTAKVSKKRSWAWPYSDVDVEVLRHNNRVKTGNTYTTVITYTVIAKNTKTKGVIPLDHHLRGHENAEKKAQFYRSLLNSPVPQQQSINTTSAAAGRPR